MKLSQKSNTIAAIGTVLFMLLCFLLLWFIVIDKPIPEEEEGIMISFGESVSGGGMDDQPYAAPPAESAAPAPQPQAPSDNDLMTQEDEEALALAKQREEDEKRAKAEEAERIRKQKEAEEAAEAERIAKEKALAEQRAREQKAIENANKLGSLFGGNSQASNQGRGNDTGADVQGNPVGKGTAGGNSWSLNGRNLHGTLAKPAATGVQEGRVVVEIRVNAAGKVVSATVTQGTTISEKATQQAACDAAYKAKFSEGNGDVRGTITYNFKNN